jgi:class 3 adenylate cyclase
MIELDTADHLIWYSEAIDAMTNEIQDFVTGAVPNTEISRVLATVLCADVSGDQTVQLIDRFRGRVVGHDPDGILATFDGPARAIRCASALVNEAEHEVRAGLHSGECEVVGDDVAGVAVQIAQAVASLARPGEILVSQTVRDLVFGSAITFGDRGSYALDDVSGEWRVYAVTGT